MKKNILLIIVIIVGMFVALTFSEYNRDRSIAACIIGQKNKSDTFDIKKAKEFCEKEIK